MTDEQRAALKIQALARGGAQVCAVPSAPAHQPPSRGTVEHGIFPSLTAVLGVGAGLLIGAILVTALSSTAVSQLNLNSDQIQALPAVLLLLALSLLLA